MRPILMNTTKLKEVRYTNDTSWFNYLYRSSIK